MKVKGVWSDSKERKEVYSSNEPPCKLLAMANGRLTLIAIVTITRAQEGPNPQVKSKFSFNYDYLKVTRMRERENVPSWKCFLQLCLGRIVPFLTHTEILTSECTERILNGSKLKAKLIKIS